VSSRTRIRPIAEAQNTATFPGGPNTSSTLLSTASYSGEAKLVYTETLPKKLASRAHGNTHSRRASPETAKDLTTTMHEVAVKCR
jgi:hypothetical protein